MEDFPKFMKKEVNKVPSKQQNTQDIDDLDSILELQYNAYQSEARLVNDFNIHPLKQTLD